MALDPLKKAHELIGKHIKYYCIIFKVSIENDHFTEDSLYSDASC